MKTCHLVNSFSQENKDITWNTHLVAHFFLFSLDSNLEMDMAKPVLNVWNKKTYGSSLWWYGRGNLTKTSRKFKQEKNILHQITTFFVNPVQMAFWFILIPGDVDKSTWARETCINHWNIFVSSTKAIIIANISMHIFLQLLLRQCK